MFELIDAHTYHQQLATAFAKAKKRIVVAAMAVVKGPMTSDLLDELVIATQRGVEVRVLVDLYYTKLYCLFDDGDFFRASRQRWRQTRDMLLGLEHAGAKVIVVGKTGPQRRNPYKHACHVKWTLVDDSVYVFGGVNFMDRSFTHADYMLRSQNKKLLSLIDTYSDALPHEVQQVALDEQNTALFDGGQPSQSIIYDRACELSRQAKHIYFVSQFQPTGRLAKAMEQTGYTAYFNHSRQLSFPANVASVVDARRHPIKNQYNRSRYIHAKYMLFVLRDGTKALLSGSHNFSFRGVAYGTQEIAIESRDPALWQDLYEFMQREIA